ncbi:MAG TPA: peptidoglycan DD-metalloendopeptidase family protein, partial [Candidatus Kapabacteria bacterium]|nr:peptidoglycan DD-metalloendopeptidase family protein [Candidatus Kapabacteria bacterium]
ITSIVVLTMLFTADVPARRVRHHAPSANSAMVREKKSELARLRAQIESYQNQLDRLSKTEHSSVKAFEAYSRQAHLLKNLIEELNGEEERLTNDIAETQQQITSSQQTLKELKAQYARAVVALYKRGTEGDLEVLLSSHNINEAVERSEYLRQFTIYRQRLAENIQGTVADLQEQQSLLTQQRDEKASIAEEKQQEQQRLTERATERSELIDKIRADKSSLKETLVRAQKSSREIESLINNLVSREIERKKRSHADRTSPFPTHPRSDRDFEDIARQSAAEEAAPDKTGFGMLRGALSWPCASHRIAEHFGDRVNPALGTVTENLGVDIKSPKNSDVFAVADGQVSLVYWLPSFGTIIIIDHHNGYRTVYANLAEATVKEGQHVRAHQVIGRSDASAAAGDVVHFEIWKDRDKQNPEIWLAKR